MSEKKPLFDTGQNQSPMRGMKGVPGEYYAKSMGKAPPAPGMGSIGEPDEFGQRPATPQEQAVLEQVVRKAQKAMMANTGNLIQQMSDPQRPLYQTVGEAALTILEGVAGVAKGADQELDQDTMLAAGEEIVESLMEIGDKANIFPFEGGSDEYMETMSMALMFGAETKANQLIAEGDPEIRASYEDKLASEIAREVDRGQGPPDEFFQGIEDARRELPRRAMYGVK